MHSTTSVRPANVNQNPYVEHFKDAGRYLGRNIVNVVENPQVRAVAAAFLRVLPFIVIGSLLPPWVNLGIVVFSYCAARPFSLADDIVNAGGVAALWAGTFDVVGGIFGGGVPQVVRGIAEICSAAFCFNKTGLAQNLGPVGTCCQRLSQGAADRARACDQKYQEVREEFFAPCERWFQQMNLAMREWSFGTVEA